MKQQGAHPGDAEGTPGASSRPDRPDTRPDTRSDRPETGDRDTPDSRDRGTRGTRGQKAPDSHDGDAHGRDSPGPGPGPGARQQDTAGRDRSRGADAMDADTVHVDEVEGDEPLLPARVHRPSDLMRLLVGVLAVVVLLAIAAFAHGTTSGLEQDI